MGTENDILKCSFTAVLKYQIDSIFIRFCFNYFDEERFLRENLVEFKQYLFFNERLVQFVNLGEEDVL